MCVTAKKKRPVLHYTLLFSVSYFNWANSARMYLDFLALRFKNSVKVLNNPGMIFV